MPPKTNSVQTAWVKPPRPIMGLDHLGTQAPCINQYGRLVPGITNVTNRARYYSLYPWVLWSIEQRFPQCSKEDFLRRLRSADFLFTLVSEAHSRTQPGTPSHSQGMTGTRQIHAAWERLERGSLELGEFVTTASSPLRYFMNPRGGLGQYYLGTLVELGLLSMEGVTPPFVGYTKERGREMAEAVDQGVPADRFWDCVERGNVTLQDLETLHAFCACAILENPPEEALLDALLRGEGSWEKDVVRRRTLALILDFGATLTASDLNAWAFRLATYGGVDELVMRPWQSAVVLDDVRAGWARYGRNEILSVLFQALFSWALSQVEQSPALFRGVPSLEALARVLTSGIQETLEGGSFADLMERMAKAVPDVSDLNAQLHEQNLADEVLETWREPEAVGLVLKGLAMLRVRMGALDDIYGEAGSHPSEYQNYPIHLGSFWERTASWMGQELSEVLRDALEWALQSHFWVALRKLRQTGESTFHLVQGEQGFEVVKGVPVPTWTNPRLSQTLRILQDLGVLREPNMQECLTEKGRRWKEELLHG